MFKSGVSWWLFFFFFNSNLILWWHELGAAAVIEREVPGVYLYERTWERLRTVCSFGEERVALHQRHTHSRGHGRGLCAAVNEGLEFQSVVMCVICRHYSGLNGCTTPSMRCFTGCTDCIGIQQSSPESGVCLFGDAESKTIHPSTTLYIQHLNLTL